MFQNLLELYKTTRLTCMPFKIKVLKVLIEGDGDNLLANRF